MAELVVRVPGEPERVVALPRKAFLVGRADVCDLQILEKKASKRHFEIAPVSEGMIGPATWVVTDLDSSNGTVVAGERILRRGIADGDTVKVGDTTLELRDRAPVVVAPPAPSTPGRSPSVVIASSLLAEPPPAPAASETSGRSTNTASSAIEEEESFSDAAPTSGLTPDDRRGIAKGRKAIARGAVVLAVGVGILVGVQTFAGGVADKRVESRQEAKDYADILASREAPYELFAGKVADFRREHRLSVRTGELEALLDARRKVHERKSLAEDELDSLQRNSIALPESQVLGRLLDLKSKMEDDPSISRRIELALGEVARRREAAAARDRALAELDADRALARGDAAAALRRLRAFTQSHPGISAAQSSQVEEKAAAIRAAAKELADKALAKAEATADPDVRRVLLGDALRGLADTSEGERLRSALVRVQGGTAPVVASGPGGTRPGGPIPTAPTTAPPATPVTQALLADAAEADRLSRERVWEASAAVYEKLAAADTAPRLKVEWAARAAEVRRVAVLAKELEAAIAASGEHPLRVALSGGTFDVIGLDAVSVKLKRADKETVTPLPAVAPADLLALFAAPARGKPTPDQHLALAVLAADLSERKAAIEHLIPLLELESHKPLAFQVVARRLEGRTAVPPGGYLVLDGDLVDQGEFTRRVEVKRVASLRAEAATIVEKLAADPGFKKLTALKAKRDALDRRRAYALLAIFNEKHWPYPHPASISGPYEVVWGEIVKRTKAVEEIWDDKEVVRLPRGGESDKFFARHDAILKELEGKGIDTEPLRGAIAPFALYAGEKELNIRTFYRDADEKTLMAYNRWVINTYNPGRTAVISDPEREQTRITNEYRMLMGYMLQVAPGPDEIDAIDPKTVVGILDKAKETARIRLYAVRIDDRLVRSARDHSIDMGKRGYFAHESPANPATGEPSMSPFDRMAKAGYQGGGMSENIAMAGSPQDAHDRWLHSSGHHRNILSTWGDQGVGQSGSLWTQNFGVGGGTTMEIPGSGTGETPPGEDDTPGAPTDPKKKRDPKDPKDKK